MYRYYLFFYENYYPSGGMEDCVLKTNNFDELMPFIKELHSRDWQYGTVAYYDALEDKYFTADIDYNFDTRKWEFLGWEEDEHYDD